jgi:hypothetical protein
VRPLPRPADPVRRVLVAPAVLPPGEAARILRPAAAGAAVYCAPCPLVAGELARELDGAARIIPDPAGPAGSGAAGGLPLDPEAAAVGLVLLRTRGATARELSALCGLGRWTVLGRLRELAAAGLVGTAGRCFYPGRGLAKALAAYLRLPAAGLYRLGPGRPGRGAHAHLARLAGALLARAWGADDLLYWPEPKVAPYLRPDGLGWLAGAVLGVEVDRRRERAGTVPARLLRAALRFYGRFGPGPVRYVVFTRRRAAEEVARAPLPPLPAGLSLVVLGLSRFGAAPARRAARAAGLPPGGALLVAGEEGVWRAG